jgi:hypothetical protein
MSRVLALCILLASLWIAAPALAVTLAWDAVTTNAEGQPLSGEVRYTVYQGPAGGSYDTQLEAGTALEVMISGLVPGQTYDFAVTAYYTADPTLESGFSNEVSWTEPVTPPPPPPPPPPAPPQIHIVSPSGPAVARRSTVLIAVVQDAGGPLTHVEVSVNEAVLCMDGTSPYGCAWAVPAPPRRTYRLQAKATDTAGQVGMSPIVAVTAE